MCKNGIYNLDASLILDNNRRFGNKHYRKLCADFGVRLGFTQCLFYPILYIFGGFTRMKYKNPLHYLLLHRILNLLKEDDFKCEEVSQNALKVLFNIKGECYELVYERIDVHIHNIYLCKDNYYIVSDTFDKFEKQKASSDERDLYIGIVCTLDNIRSVCWYNKEKKKLSQHFNELYNTKDVYDDF